MVFLQCKIHITEGAEAEDVAELPKDPEMRG